MWFDVLKNEMRTINLPKFKIKPFGETKPDEEDNDCKDRFLNEVLKKSVQKKLIHNNPKGSLQSLFNEIKEMGEENDYQVSNINIEQDNYGIDARFKLYPLLSDGFANPNTFVEVKIIEDNEQDTIKQDVNEIPEEVYCKALDMINRGSPRREGKYIEESVGDWNIRYNHIDRISEGTIGYDAFSKWTRVRKDRTITIRKGEVVYITLSNLLLVRTTYIRGQVKYVWDSIENPKKGISAAYRKIESHFEDVKIEW